jgi:tRNA nucleotidyltransferase (CCA-adding enzyme)
LAPSLQNVLFQVKRRIVPTLEERKLMENLSERLKDELERILNSDQIQAKVSVQGSMARDTWLSGEHDLDLFAEFPENTDRREWTANFIPAVRRGFRRYRKVERYAEHPYLELLADDEVRVNIVPCYQVERGRWKSATDRSRYHSEYMRSHLTEELRNEARLLKKFLKGIRTYGAEIRIGGFSGMLVETLTLHFRSFVGTLQQASSWKEPVFIDLEKNSTPRKFDSEFVVVDPVDPGRNLASAVRPDRMWSFVAAAREFLKSPQLSFFYPPKARARSRREFLSRMKGPHYDLVAIQFPHPRLVLDVLWGQLFSLQRALLGLFERNEFHAVRSEVWSDESRLSVVLMEIEAAVLPSAQFHKGPPVPRQAESEQFLARHLGAKNTVRGPWLAGARWAVEKKREDASVKDLLKTALGDGRYGLSVPKQLDASFHRGARALVNEEVMSLFRQPGFGEALWDFLDGRPEWLRTRK